MLEKFLIHLGRHVGKPRGYERLVRLFCAPEKCGQMPPRLIAAHGEPLFRADPRTPLGWNVLFFGGYEPELRSLMVSFLKPGYTALDVGANVGWHTLLMAARVGSGGRVLAFEPNPSVRNELVRNVELNRFRHAQILPYALSDRDESVAFVAPPVHGLDSGNGFVVGGSGQGEPNVIQVEARTLDTLLPLLDIERLDFIKMDIEGMEYRALLGMKNAVERFRPVIAWEFYSDGAKRCGGSRELLGQLIQTYSYETFVISRWGTYACSYPDWPACCDLVSIPK